MYGKRGIQKKLVLQVIESLILLPLNEVIFDFHDRLKSISKIRKF